MSGEQRNILVVGPDNGINNSIVHHLIENGDRIFWLKVETKNQGNASDQSITSEGLQTIDLKKEMSLKEGLVGFGDTTFYGVLFANGIGGVRPAKLNNEDFVMEMLRANTISFTELVALLLKKRKIESGGSIIALSSVSSFRGLKSKTAYSASKAALDAVVRGLALELAPKRIRVNSIRKGWVTSDMSLDFLESNRAIGEKDDMEQQVLGAIQPQEIAVTVEYLLDSRMKSVTGTHLLVDGGYSI